ncbi:MAG: triose-phosphate isomerase [Sphaerochaetaceae bacterium]|jgi:triosephosphate isomerase|nr:triose-phosphate isomerase [Sphaerochaetaceae bacterium]MDD3365836.1 triose-phosphate isomerase [Sphaerochaetaceae bacterium]MDD4219166.1 triose-phosphate isomerase [Sphaerochaetaceae bacterium]MDY0372172.1 triose-phosphate isomerase [Sphaerochaetaceae bacterium]
MRKVCIAGNWKMNMTPSEGVVFAKALAEAVKDASVRVVVAPPFVTIPGVAEALQESSIEVAAQNMADHLSGAYTGEVSAPMLKELGVSVVILGHSERRALYGESDAFINRKVKLALAEDLDVILCVGETLEEREAGQLETVLKRQVIEGLKDVSASEMSHIIIAYEPVWAIGTGKTATPDDANSAHAFIRSEIEKLYSKSVAESLIIQYGGSVKPSNVKDLMAMKHIDGALVGGAALSVEQFGPIVRYNK